MQNNKNITEILMILKILSLSVLKQMNPHKSLHEMNDRCWFTVDVYFLRTIANILFFHVHFVMWHSAL